MKTQKIAYSGLSFTSRSRKQQYREPHLLYARVTVNGKRTEISVKRSVAVSRALTICVSVNRPEEEAAERWAKKLCQKGGIDSFELNKNFSFVEIIISEKYIGKSIEENRFRKQYNILVLSIIKNTEEISFLCKSKTVLIVQDIPDPTTILEKDDILFIYGANEDLQKFAKSR